jgi:threonine/homoserine/homoserine lactone efflux protein
MIDASTLLVFSLAALALTASPGPDMLLIASRSAAQGRVAGLATWAGIAVGTYCHALAAAFGLSQLLLAAPTAYDFVRYTGAAYLLYLAWKAFTSSAQEESRSTIGRKNHSTWTVFQQGLFTNLLNPKMAIFVLALFPQFVVPDAGSLAVQIMILATVLNLIGFFVNGIVILAASRATAFLFGNRKIRSMSQYLLGTVFSGLAIKLAFDTER